MQEKPVNRINWESAGDGEDKIWVEVTKQAKMTKDNRSQAKIDH